MKVVLKMTDVSKVYPGGSVALQNVDIHIEPGEFVFVVGPSGAGKSTFIKMLFREVLPTTGSIFVNGVDILSLTPNEIPYMRRQLGIIFQDYRLLPDRTVYENVAFAMEVIETPRRKIKRRVLNVLDLVGLRHRADAYPNELSGGEQQRIAIARAIVNSCRCPADTVVASDSTVSNPCGKECTNLSKPHALTTRSNCSSVIPCMLYTKFSRTVPSNSHVSCKTIPNKSCTLLRVSSYSDLPSIVMLPPPMS